MLSFYGLERHIANPCDDIHYFEGIEDRVLADSRDLYLSVRCLLENSLHQKDVEVHLLGPHSDKVRVVLVELRVGPELSSFSVLRFRASRATRFSLRPASFRFLILAVLRLAFLVESCWTGTSRSLRSSWLILDSVG